MNPRDLPISGPGDAPAPSYSPYPEFNARRRQIDDLERRALSSTDTVAQIVPMLDHPSPSIRARAARALGRLGQRASSAAPKLLGMFGDASPRVVQQAISALGAVATGRKAEITALVGKLADARASIRALAVDALSLLARADQLEMRQLTRCLDDTSHRVRAWTLQALRAIWGPSKDLLPLARERLEDPCVYVRATAVSLIGAMGPAAASEAPGIVTLAKGDPGCLLDALLALAKICPDADRSGGPVGSCEAPEHPVSFRDGVLWDLSARPQQAVAAWPDLRAWYRGGPNARWRRSVTPAMNIRWMTLISEEPVDDGSGQYLMPWCAPHHEAAQAYRMFFRRVPRHLLQLACSFPHGHWRILTALAKLGNDAVDLASSNPALLFMLAHRRYFGRDPSWPSWECTKILAKTRQTYALQELGFAGRECVARLLRGIPVGTCSVRNLRLLRRLLRDPAHAKLLSHLPRINASVLAILAERRLRRLATPGLLAEVGSDTSNDEAILAASELGDVIDLAEALGAVEQLRPVRSMRELSVLGQKLDRRLRAALANPQEFPTPPLAGSPGRAEPIRNAKELVEEGEKMRHCAGRYVAIVAAGRGFFYRILPDRDQGVSRATLLIEPRGLAGRWAVRQVRGWGNCPVSQPTRDMAVRFVSQSQESEVTLHV